ncbi:MAG: hypothetical protein IT561_22550 [Alphaproteobacteria bacterium]|nr:hypothetical protein [Alphaproteobacteria bacterium]
MLRVAEPELFDRTHELGMGYHFGELQFAGEAGFIVLNGEVAVTAGELDLPPGILASLIAETLRAGERAAIVPSENVGLLVRVFRRHLPYFTPSPEGPPIHGSPPFVTVFQPGEKFVRFSAFANDRRLAPGNGLLPGSYATSERDGQFVNTGYAAVGRYALPNPVAAQHRLAIVVGKAIGALVGTVRPAFGNAGGGVEAEFPLGLPAGSVVGKLEMPEY